jgi:hypothetical protein
VVRIEDAGPAFELVVLPSRGLMVVGSRKPSYEPSVWLISATGTILTRRDIPMEGFGASTMAATRAPGNRVVVAIAAQSAPPTRRVTVIIRLTEGNQLDRGFGEAGIVRAPSPPDAEVGYGAVAVRSNGTIVFAGPCRYCPGPSVRISQLDARGNIDKSFGNDGRVRLSSTRLNRIGHGVRGLVHTRFVPSGLGRSFAAWLGPPSH